MVSATASGRADSLGEAAFALGVGANAKAANTNPTHSLRLLVEYALAFIALSIPGPHLRLRLNPLDKLV